MVLSRVIESHKATSHVTYELCQADIVGMGSHDGVFAYTIYKRTDGNRTAIVKGIKSKQAVDLVWADIKKGVQK